MNNDINNIYKPPIGIDKEEVFENLHLSKKIKIERIFTQKPYETPGEWFDQPQDEWVLLLKGKAKLEFKNDKIIEMNEGDYIFIPAHKIHRVYNSSKEPKCVWLAIHGKLK
ncbi:MAG: cupin domain-containing protein [Bacteroidales bacterium]|nr:cupin domain-containing protein [Bacteroidales bacterium]